MRRSEMESNLSIQEFFSFAVFFYIASSAAASISSSASFSSGDGKDRTDAYVVVDHGRYCTLKVAVAR